MPLLEKSFGSWKAEGMAPLVAEVPNAPQLKSRQIYIVDKPGAAQSQIRIGWIGVPRSTPDYFALQVLNTILGGSFTSRLNQNLREEHGYSLRRQLGVRHAPLGRAVLGRRPACRPTRPPNR